MLVLRKKTGFLNTSSKPIIILDYRGIVFYDTSILNKRVKKFNLPSGKYFIKSGKFIKLPKPLKYRVKPLPKIQRKLPQGKLRVVFEENPNKATIYHLDNGQRIIKIDPSFKSRSLPEIWFIYFHEIGHKYYSHEIGPDAYARNVMLKKGYNPSQIALAAILTLGPKSFNRKLITLRTTKQ